MTGERISLEDDSLIASYAENIQRYDFALRYCKDKRVLDAGCGSGYGAHFLAANGAKSVVGLDLSPDAINEARTNYRRENLLYDRRDIESLDDDQALKDQFEVVVNFENVAHLVHPERMVRGVSLMLPNGATFIISTPNSDSIALDETGKPLYKFQHRAYTHSELTSLVAPYFNQISLYGQWLTHSGLLRKVRAKELFDQICEAYYNPMSKIGRLIKRVTGAKVTQSPLFTAAADSFPGDFEICDLESKAYPWAPTVLLAVCKK